jgi:alpha-L-rhamnosidase
VAGLQLIEPGYRRFRIRPQPGGGVTSARAHHESPHGRIEVSWALDDATGTLDVTVPSGSEAELLLPDGSGRLYGAGNHRMTWTEKASTS